MQQMQQIQQLTAQREGNEQAAKIKVGRLQRSNCQTNLSHCLPYFNSPIFPSSSGLGHSLSGQGCHAHLQTQKEQPHRYSSIVCRAGDELRREYPTRSNTFVFPLLPFPPPPHLPPSSL
jgi:hypothetical protein